MSAWSDVSRAVSEARATFSSVDEHAGAMAKLLVGRLRHVDGRTLKLLKAELRDFDAAGWNGRGWS